MALRNILAPRQQVTTAAGNVLSGGKVFLFEPGTTTFVTSFRDSGLVTPHTNPVRLSGSGRANIWISRDVDMFIVPRTNISDLIPTDIVIQELRANPDSLGVDEAGGLVPNGSFEIDTDADTVPDSWTLTSELGATNALDTSESTDGAQSFRFTSSGSGGGSLVTDDFFPVNDVDPLRVNVDLRSTVAAVRNIVRVEWYDVSQVFISNSDAYDSTANPLAFTTQNLVIIPPALARFARLRLIGIDPSVLLAGSTFFDRVSVFYPAVVTGVFDNITIQNNEIITTNLNGDLNLRPNGTGSVVIDQNGVNRFVTAAALIAVRSDGNLDTEARRLEFQHQDGTRRGFVGHSTAGAVVLRNDILGLGVEVEGTDVGGVVRNLIVADPDTGVTLGAAAFNRFITSTLGRVILRSDGNTDTENRHIRLEHADGTLRGIMGYDGSGAGALTLANQINGAPVVLQAFDAGGVVRNLIAADPDTGVTLGAAAFNRFITSTLGRVILRSDGNLDTENRHIRLEHADGTLRGIMGYDGSGTGALTLANQINGAPVVLQAFDAGGVNRLLVSADPDDAAQLAFQGIFTARSAAAASGGLEANNTLTGAGFERVLTASDLVDTQTGTFTGTLTGYAVNPTGTINFTITGNHCTLYNNGAQISGTSNSNFMTMTGLPAAVQPTNPSTGFCPLLLDNGVNGNTGTATVNGAAVSFAIGEPAAAGGFAGANGKGIASGWSITYQLE